MQELVDQSLSLLHLSKREGTMVSMESEDSISPSGRGGGVLVPVSLLNAEGSLSREGWEAGLGSAPERLKSMAEWGESYGRGCWRGGIGSAYGNNN